MSSIALTNKCQLNCNYCFANDFVNNKYGEISEENFKFALNFLKTGSKTPLKLAGGEPLLHSKFPEFIDIITNDDFFKTVVIFTNGLELDKYIDKLTDSKYHILINCNSIADIGESLFNKLKNNIKLLVEKKLDSFELGINLHYKGMDYSYIFELLKLANRHRVRLSIAVSNTDKQKTNSILDSFKDFKPYLMQFFKDCLRNEIVPYYDCNTMPDCLLEPEDIKILKQLDEISKKYQLVSTVKTVTKCVSDITILPDLTAIRCFSQEKLGRVNIKDFYSYFHLENYFFNTMDIYFNVAFISKECENCKSRIYNRCGICPMYNIERIEKMKKLAADFS